MGILLVDDNAADREGLATVLRKASYRVERTGDARGARDVLERFSATAVILAWPKTGGPELVRWLRGRDACGRRAHVLALVDKQITDLRPIFAAGVDDFAWKPVGPEELLTRVDAPRRIRKWARQLGASETGVDWSAYSDVRRLRSCQQLGPIVAEDLMQMFGEEIEVTPGCSGDIEGELRGATIPMALPNELSEVQISVLVESGMTPLLGDKLLGDAAAPAAAIDDILRELANAAGGAVKRVGLQEGVTFTTGLPVTPCEHPIESDRSAFWVATLKESGLRIRVAVETRAQQNHKVGVLELREGMVLAGDLRNDSGVLLVAAGTRLTATSADRIRNMLNRKVTVEIARAA